jgi:hypothetical protein
MFCTTRSIEPVEKKWGKESVEGETERKKGSDLNNVRVNHRGKKDQLNRGKVKYINRRHSVIC